MTRLDELLAATASLFQSWDADAVARWEALRDAGRRAWVLGTGVCVYGAILTVGLFLGLVYLLEPAPPAIGIGDVLLRGGASLLCGMAAGVVFGLGTWRGTEASYARYLRSQRRENAEADPGGAGGTQAEDE